MLNSSQIPDSNFIRSKEKGQRSTSMSENTSSLIPRDHPAPLRMYILPAEKSSLFLRRAVPVLSLPVLNYAVFSPLNALSSWKFDLFFKDQLVCCLLCEAFPDYSVRINYFYLGHILFNLHTSALLELLYLKTPNNKRE